MWLILFVMSWDESNFHVITKTTLSALKFFRLMCLFHLIGTKMGLSVQLCDVFCSVAPWCFLVNTDDWSLKEDFKKQKVLDTLVCSHSFKIKQWFTQEEEWFVERKVKLKQQEEGSYSNILNQPHHCWVEWKFAHLRINRVMLTSFKMTCLCQAAKLHFWINIKS